MEALSPITKQGVEKLRSRHEKFRPNRSSSNPPRYGLIIDFTRELWVYVRFDDEVTFKTQATYPV